MNCLICAYARRRVPLTPDKPESSTRPPVAVGTCSRCSVEACAIHGARVGTFLCAICEGADVVQTTLAPDSVPATVRGGGLPKARVIGEAAPESLRRTVDVALRRINDDGIRWPDRNGYLL